MIEPEIPLTSSIYKRPSVYLCRYGNSLDAYTLGSVQRKVRKRGKNWYF